MTNAQESVGFIGVGYMGHCMAKNIVEKGYALADVLSQVCKYAVRIGFPPHIYADILARLSDIEYRLAFATSDKLQLASLVGAFVAARTKMGAEAVGAEAPPAAP